MKNKEKSNLDIGLISRLFTFLKPYTKYLYFALSLTIIISAISPLRPYLTKIAIDSYIANSDMSGLINMIILIFSLILLQGLIQFSQNYLMQWIGQNVLADIRTKLFRHIQSLSMKYFDKNPIGRLVTRVTNDIEALNELFSSGVVMALADILLIFWIVAFMFYTNVTLALLTLSVLPFLIIATFIFKNKVRVVFRDIRVKVASMNSFLNESISGISSVKLFMQEDSRKEKFDDINKDTKYLWIKTVYYHALFFPIVEFLGAFAVAMVLYYTAGNILNDTLTVGVLVAFLQYSEMFFRPIRDLAEKFTTLQGALASGERIIEVFDTNEIIAESEINEEFSSFKDSIEFKNVKFSYDDSKVVLSDLNFKINKGEKIAIVGATGSGKTSIINILLKLYEFNSGAILIDGKDIRQINRNDLLKRFALVMQDVFLFSRSINDNISLGREHINEVEVLQSIQEIGALDFITNLEEGSSTLLNERGNSLSTGQKQLISFSRAYTGKPDILVLDEATSNIDSETEKQIEAATDKLLENKTAIIIAHRLSTVRKADRIIVLHNGEIREIGTHRELLAKKGLYAKLYKLQFEAMDK